MEDYECCGRFRHADEGSIQSFRNMDSHPSHVSHRFHRMLAFGSMAPYGRTSCLRMTGTRTKKSTIFQLEKLLFFSRLSVEFSQMIWERVSHKHTRYCVHDSTLSTTCCQNFFKNCAPFVFMKRNVPLFDFSLAYVVHRFFTF